jgi:hypothetical protein
VPGALFPLLLAIHIALAVALLLPNILLPFVLRGAGGPSSASSPIVRLLMAIGGSGSLVIAAGLAITGAALVALLGVSLLSQPWLLAALAIYAGNLGVAAFVSRPNLRRLIGLPERDPVAWRRTARQQRWIAYGMAAAIGVIGLLMSTKPQLW